MDVMLIGRGHLGTFLEKRLRDNFNIIIHYMTDINGLDVGVLKPVDVIINTVGKTDLKWCEENPLEAFRCNVTAPLEVFRSIGKLDPLFIHLSSGCVWDGPYDKNKNPFEPYSPPMPACFYAWTKAACDALMIDDCGKHKLCILRPRQVYSPLHSPRNTLSKLCSYPKLIDTPNSMTSAETIAKTIEAVADNPGWFRGGRIVNVYDRGIASPFLVGKLLADAGLRAMPEELTKSELDVFLKPKRVDVVLHDDWFERLVSPPLVFDELQRVVNEFVVNG